jgi:membrane protease YdiL (CAAX protease family)
MRTTSCPSPQAIAPRPLCQVLFGERITRMESSEVSTQSASAGRGFRPLMRQRPLFFFFLIAFAFSWLLSIPAILSAWGILPAGVFGVFFTLKAFGPLLAAYIMTSVIEGREGVLRLTRSLKRARAGWRWYVFILIGIPCLLLLGIVAMPGALASFKGLPPHFLATYVVSFVIIFFVGGPLGEEPGWRGFALPRMQPRYGPLWGTLLLGVLWVFWHLPDFLTVAQRGGPGTNPTTLLTTSFPIFFVMVIAMAVIFTWVFNRTAGSVFIAILLHTSINTFGLALALFNAPVVTSTDLAACIGVAVPALLIVLLTRGRLGYRPGQGHVVE